MVASPTPTVPISSDSTRGIETRRSSRTAKAAAAIHPAGPPPTMTMSRMSCSLMPAMLQGAAQMRNGRVARPLETCCQANIECAQRLGSRVQDAGEREVDMFALLLAFTLVADVAQTGFRPPQDEAAEKCRTRLEHKLNGELSDFTVTDSARIGRSRVVNGRVSVLKRPSAVPGDLSPHHVQRLDYLFACRVRGGRISHLTLRTPNR